MNESAADAKAALLAELETNPSAVITTFQKGKVLDTLDANPKHRTALRTMVADQFPGTADQMPETAVAKAVGPALLQLQEERAALQKERADDAQKKARAAWLASIKSFGIPEKDLPGVEALASERANLDPESLAMLWKAQHAPLRSSGGFGRPLIPGAGQDAFFEGILKDPDGWLLNRAHTLWDAEHAGRDLDTIDWTKEVIA